MKDYSKFPAPLNVTQEEVEMIYAALMAVSPTGGGSSPFILAHKVLGMTPYGCDADRHDRLVAIHTKSVLDDAVAAGVAKHVTNGGRYVPKSLIIRRCKNAAEDATHPYEVVTVFQNAWENHEGSRHGIQCRDTRQCMCIATGMNEARSKLQEADLPIEWQDGLELEPEA